MHTKFWEAIFKVTNTLPVIRGKYGTTQHHPVGLEDTKEEFLLCFSRDITHSVVI
jgi:hypothetical protein